MFVVSALAFGAAGCDNAPTFPAAKVPKSVQDIGRSEYDINLKARVVGKTLGAVVYVPSLKDKTGQIAKEVHEVMSKAMQAVTRVALSTDLDLNYCVVFIRDVKTPQEIVITRSVDDTRRGNADMIGMEEQMRRTLIGQAVYKPAVEGPNSAFILRDIKKEDFLADQMVQRIHLLFAKPPKDEDESVDEALIPESLVLVDGNYDRSHGKRSFTFAVIALRKEDPIQMMLSIFSEISAVIEGYKFEDYDRVEIQDFINRRKLIVDRQTLTLYQQKKISEQELIERCLVESQSMQEALKLVGFVTPQDASDDAPASPAAVGAKP